MSGLCHVLSELGGPVLVLAETNRTELGSGEGLGPALAA